MKKYIVLLTVLLMTTVSWGALTYDAEYIRKNITSVFDGSTKSPYYLRNSEIDELLAGTGGVGALYLTPGTAPATPLEGQFYYDAIADVVKFRNASAWVTLASSSSGTLDEAYDAGAGITADSGALAITVTDDSGNAGLTVAQNDATNNSNGIEVTMCASNTGAGLYINGTTGTVDLLGDNFSIANTGALVCVGVDTTGTITLANDETILNDTNNEIQFGNGTEDISFGFGTGDTLTLTSDTSVATIAFGDLDAFTGVASITGDAGADFALAVTNTGTFNFTIAQSGVGDNELRLTSAGTAANAIALTASTGGITATAATSMTGTAAAGAISFTATGGDATLASADKSTNVTGAEAAANAIVIDASNAAGGIDMDCGSGGFNLLATAGDVTITNTTAKDIIIDAQAGRVLITGTESAADAIALIADGANGEISLAAKVGGIDMDAAAGPIAIDNSGAGMDITLTSDAGRVIAKAEEAADNAITLVSAAGGIDVDAAKSIVITSTENTADSVVIQSTLGGIDIICDAGIATEDIDITATASSVHVIGGEAIADAITLASTGGVDITSAATFDIDVTATGGTVQVIASEAAANQFKVDAQGTIADASGDAIVLETTNGGILIDADGVANGDIGLEAGDDLRLTTVGDMIFTIGGVARVVDDDIVSFGTTDNVTMAYDEDGDNNLQIIGPVDFETTYHEFRSNGVAAQSDGTIVGVATGETNIFVTEGKVFEYFVLGAGQTISVPTLTDDGLNIMQDEADNEGAEWTRGITARAPDVYTVETDVFYFKVKFKIETVAELDICTVGFRIAGAYNADMYAYNTYTGLNVNNGTINEVEELNGANAAEVDTGEAWADGETHELEVRIAIDGTTTWFVDGAAITNQGTTCVFDWTDTDVVIPYFHYLQDDNNGCELELITWETGIYNQ